MYQLHGCSLGSSSAPDLALPSLHTADSRGDKSSVDYGGLGSKCLMASAEAMLTPLMASVCALAADSRIFISHCSRGYSVHTQPPWAMENHLSVNTMERLQLYQ